MLCGYGVRHARLGQRGDRRVPARLRRAGRRWLLPLRRDAGRTHPGPAKSLGETTFLWMTEKKISVLTGATRPDYSIKCPAASVAFIPRSSRRFAM